MADILDTHVKQGSFTPLYLLYGNDTFMIKYKTDRFCKKVLGDSITDFNYIEFDGRNIDYDMLYDAVNAMPMFCDFKCVKITDLDLDSLKADPLDELLSLFEEVPETTVLVISLVNIVPDFKKSDRWKRLLQIVQKYGTVFEAVKMTKSELLAWANNGLGKIDSYISAETFEYLIKTLGTDDMNTLRNELYKLAAYSRGAIEKRHIDEFAFKHIEGRVFEMVNALSRKDFDTAYLKLTEMFELGNSSFSPQLILGTVSSVFTDLYRAKIGFDSGRSINQICEDFNYPPNMSFKIKNAVTESRRFGKAGLIKCIDYIMLADEKLKTSGIDHKIILTELLVQISTVEQS